MKFLLLLSLTTLATGVLGAAPGTEAIIQRARATIGTEEALQELTTLQITGRIEAFDAKLPDASIKITARKPCSKRLEVKMDEIIETTIVHGKRGCIIRSSISHAAPHMRMLTDEEKSRVRFNVRQFFTFFRPSEESGEAVRFDGVTEKHGVSCYSLVYTFPEGGYTTRYFSIADGSLISTVTDLGVESIERGQRIVAGIKFPERIDYYEDSIVLHTLVLEEIKVNKPLKAGVFRIPFKKEK